MDIAAKQVWKHIDSGKQARIEYTTASTVNFVWLGGDPYLRYEMLGEFLESFELVGKPDAVNNPPHYTSHPSGVKCIEITRHMGFAAGNVIKYLWRNGLKDGEPSIKDLKKAAWYLNDLIEQEELKQRG